MKKRILAIMAVLFVVVFATGCFGDPVKSDLEDYIKFEQSTQQEALDFNANFMAKANTAANKEEAVQILTDGAQKLGEITDKQKNYKPTTKEVQDIHAKSVQVLETTLQSLNDMRDALQNDTFSKETLKKFQNTQVEAANLTKDYYNDISKLGAEKKVEVKMGK